MDEDSKDTAVLVAGGFHSDGIAEILRERGINYLTITPNISNYRFANSLSPVEAKPQ